MSWKDGFHKALLEYVGAEEGSTFVGLETDSYDSGGCETCAYTEYTVEISWRTPKGNYMTHQYSGRLDSLIEALTNE